MFYELNIYYQTIKIVITSCIFAWGALFLAIFMDIVGLGLAWNSELILIKNCVIYQVYDLRITSSGFFSSVGARYWHHIIADKERAKT